LVSGDWSCKYQCANAWLDGYPSIIATRIKRLIIKSPSVTTSSSSHTPLGTTIQTCRVVIFCLTSILFLDIIQIHRVAAAGRSLGQYIKALNEYYYTGKQLQVKRLPLIINSSVSEAKVNYYSSQRYITRLSTTTMMNSIRNLHSMSALQAMQVLY